MHIVYGHWCFVCSDSIGICLRGVVDLPACWTWGFGRHSFYLFGVGGIPLCILRTIWREHNYHAFERIERSPLELKLFLLCSMYDWMAVLSGHSFSTLEEFLDLRNFR